MMASLIWNDAGNSSSTSFTVRHILYTVQIVYAEYTDLTRNFQQGWWYGIISYSNITTYTAPCNGMQAAKTASLKITSNINGIPPLPIPPPPPIVILTAFTICSTSSFPNLSGYVTGSDLKWYMNTPDSTGMPSPITSNAPGVYDFWVSQTVGGIESTKIQMIITVNAVPKLQYTGPLNYYYSSTINLVANTSDLNSTGCDITFWSNSGFSSQISNPSNFTTGGVVYIMATTGAGCQNILVVNIAVPTSGLELSIELQPVLEWTSLTQQLPSIGGYRGTLSACNAPLPNLPLTFIHTQPLVASYSSLCTMFSEGIDEYLAGVAPRQFIPYQYNESGPYIPPMPLISLNYGIDVYEPPYGTLPMMGWFNTNMNPISLVYKDNLGNSAVYAPVILLDNLSVNVIDYLISFVNVEEVSSTPTEMVLRLTIITNSINYSGVSVRSFEWQMDDAYIDSLIPDPSDPGNPRKALITLPAGRYEFGVVTYYNFTHDAVVTELPSASSSICVAVLGT